MAKKPDLLFELMKQTQAAQAAQAEKVNDSPAVDVSAVAAPSIALPAATETSAAAASDTVCAPTSTVSATAASAADFTQAFAGQDVTQSMRSGYIDVRPAARVLKIVPVTHQTIIVAVVIAMCVFFAGVLCGRWSAFAAVDRASDRAFDALRNEPPQPDALDVGPASPLDRVAAAESPSAEATSGSSSESASLSGNYTRKPGLNYLIIERFEKRAQAEKARTFLAEHGVEATIESASQSVILVSKLGFDFSVQKVEKDAFKRQVETLGLQYAKRAGSDGYGFQTCYYARLSTQAQSSGR